MKLWTALCCASMCLRAAGLSSKDAIGPIAPSAVFFENGGAFTGTNLQRWARYEVGGTMRLDSGLAMSFVGASPSAKPRGIEKSGALIHRIRGRMGKAEVSPGYAAVRYADLYPGIALECRFSDRGFKTDFLLDAGADPSRIAMRYSGIGKASVGLDGQLRILTAAGEMEERIPAVFQTKPDGSVLYRKATYTLTASGVVGFAVDEIDPALPTVIDPDLTYSSYFGGNRNENITAVALGTDDTIFVAGWTESTDLPTGSPYQSTNRGSTDGFVAKLSANGQTLLWATYFGGTSADRITGMVVDASNRPVVAGSTSSSDFPTRFAVQTTLRGGSDAFVARFSASGASLDFSTYFGGTQADVANAVAADHLGVYLAGQTTSTDLPVVGALYSPRGGQDGFLVKLNPAGMGIAFATYVGGNFDDSINAIATWNGEIFVAGGTTSSNIPVVGGLGPRGGMDAFVMRFNSAGSALVGSTYLGGTGGSVFQPEMATAIRVSSAGEPFVGGITVSSDFPATPSSAQSVFGRGGSDGFVVKYSTQFNSVQWATFLGGSGADQVTGITLRTSGQVAVTGFTSSTNFPRVSPTQSTFGGLHDAFVAVYSNFGSLVFSTVFGGSGSDSSASIAAGSVAANNLVFGGTTSSTNLTMAGTPYQAAGDPQSLNGFLARLTVSGGFLRARDRIGIYRTSTTGWALDRNGNYRWDDVGDLAFALGNPGDLPVVGDWDGTNRWRVGIFRGGVWYYDMNGDNAWTWGVDRFSYFGIPGDIPLVGDWTGSGKSQIAVYRAGTLWVDLNGDGAWTDGVDRGYVVGTSSDIPVAGDWTGSGITRVGLYHNGVWRLDINGDFQWTAADQTLNLGQAGDIPIPCDPYNTGQSMTVVWRPSNGAWITPLGVLGYFGFPGDIPIAAPWQQP